MRQREGMPVLLGLITAETVNAAASVATLFVIAATAVLALRQLQHLRASNQISAMMEYERLLLSQEFAECRSRINLELSHWLDDEATMARFLSRTGEEYRVVTLVANCFENLGTMVRHEMIDPDLACEVWAFVTVGTWNALAPLTALVRARLNPAIWENFEYFTVLSMRTIARHPEGTYPANVPRAPLPAAPAVRAAVGD